MNKYIVAVTIESLYEIIAENAEEALRLAEEENTFQNPSGLINSETINVQIIEKDEI